MALRFAGQLGAVCVLWAGCATEVLGSTQQWHNNLKRFCAGLGSVLFYIQFPLFLLPPQPPHEELSGHAFPQPELPSECIRLLLGAVDGAVGGSFFLLSWTKACRTNQQETPRGSVDVDDQTVILGCSGVFIFGAK